MSTKGFSGTSAMVGSLSLQTGCGLEGVGLGCEGGGTSSTSVGCSPCQLGSEISFPYDEGKSSKKVTSMVTEVFLPFLGNITLVAFLSTRITHKDTLNCSRI